MPFQRKHLLLGSQCHTGFGELVSTRSAVGEKERRDVFPRGVSLPLFPGILETRKPTEPLESGGALLKTSETDDVPHGLKDPGQMSCPTTSPVNWSQCLTVFRLNHFFF